MSGNKRHDSPTLRPPFWDWNTHDEASSLALQMIVESLGGSFCDDHLFLDAKGHAIHLSHGSSTAFVYYEQVLAREAMFADQTSQGR